MSRTKPLKVGDRVDEFESVDQHGNAVTLRELLADGRLVVYFYPKAMTAGCTRQSCRFRDLASEFKGLGASVVGVSTDRVGRQVDFDEAHSLGFPLLSDPSRVISGSFGVARRPPLPNKRATFVIDRDRTVIEAVRSETNMSIHSQAALEALRKAVGA